MKITHCKLKKSIQKKLLQFFVLEVTARSAADLLGIHPNSAVLFYRKIREVISHHLSLEADTVFDGSIELDESYFGEHRKGKLGRGAADKVAVFGILKRGGKVYTVVIENAKRETLFPVITKKINSKTLRARLKLKLAISLPLPSNPLKTASAKPNCPAKKPNVLPTGSLWKKRWKTATSCPALSMANKYSYRLSGYGDL